MHEIAHSLGVGHEQSRFDRDAHVYFHPERSRDEVNFRVRSRDAHTVLTPYDVSSNMHYSAWVNKTDAHFHCCLMEMLVTVLHHHIVNCLHIEPNIKSSKLLFLILDHSQNP